MLTQAAREKLDQIATNSKGTVTISALNDGQLYMIATLSPINAAVDATCDMVLTLYKSWPIDKPIYIVLDFMRAWVTPYTRHRATEFNRNSPRDLERYLAVLVSAGPYTTLINTFIRIAFGTNPKMKIRVFNTREKAVAWLESVYAQRSASAAQ